jgi:hypothetical protein
LIWLAPAAWSVRSRNPCVKFLAFLAGVGFCGAFGLPPVANLLRAIPVLDVADNRRLTLWLAFSLVLLGGYGIDATSRTIGLRGWILWTRSWVVLALLLAIGAGGVVAFGPRIRQKSLAHYALAAAETPGANPAIYQERAERQARMTVAFLPRYYLLSAAQLLILAGLAEILRREHHSTRTEIAVRAALVALAVADLLLFGYDLNPAIPRDQDRPDSDVIAYLRQNVPPPLRVLAVGAELPPNLLMRYGLADVRNYDSIELSRNLTFFRDLYEAEPDRRSMQTSRRTILWEGVERSLEQLKIAGVGAIVGATRPSQPQRFSRVDHVGRVWIARLDSTAPREIRVNPGEIRIDLGLDPGQVGWIAETFDPGWKAEVDGQRVSTIAFRDVFLGVPLPRDAHRVVFRYEPLEVRIAAILSLLSLFLIGILAYVERSPEKTAIESWNQIPHVVRIEPNTIARPPLPGSPSTEGRDADGPLHV